LRVRSRRLFFALWPDETVRRALLDVEALVVPATARATRAENLHLTLAFLGAVPPEQLPAVLDVAGQLRCSPIALTLDRIEHWAAPGILCLAPSVMPKPLQALAADLESALREGGLPVDQRPYRPHVTLCRKASAPLLEPALLGAGILWRADQFVLAESADDTGSSSYRIIAHWPLQSLH